MYKNNHTGCHSGDVHFGVDVFSHLDWIREMMELKGEVCHQCSRGDAWETDLHRGLSGNNHLQPILHQVPGAKTTTTTVGKYASQVHILSVSHL